LTEDDADEGEVVGIVDGSTLGKTVGADEGDAVAV
jgi:hypothetical protein